MSGAIDRLTGTASAFSFFVSAREVREFDDVRRSALTNGRRVEVKGLRESNGTVRARRVRPDR